MPRKDGSHQHGHRAAQHAQDRIHGNRGRSSRDCPRGHKIRSITLGKDVRRIGTRAFKGCEKLKTINMRKSGALTLHRDGLVWSVDSCNIGYGAFSNVNPKVKVQCGSTYSAFKSAYKTALVTRGLPTTAKIVY